MTTETVVSLPPSPPKFVIKTLNASISMLLRSPLHGVLSKSSILLSFQGSKSGKVYTFPVGYYELHGNTFFIIPLHRWWRNLRGNAPVTVWLKGHKYQGIASATQGDAETVRELQRLIEDSPNLIRLYKIARDERGQLDARRTRQVAQSLPLVRVRLNS